MLKTMWLFHLCFLSLYAITGAAREQVEMITLHDPSQMVLQGFSHTGLPIAISVSNEHLKEVSSSVLMAESWIRTHILNHYPSINITTIVVGHSVLCNKDQHKMGLVLPSIKNIYHSLTRWGLEREIKVSASFSSNCLNPNYDLAEKYVKPLLTFLQDTKSTYLVNPPPNLSILSDEEQTLVSSHKGFMKKLGFFNLNKIKLIITSTKESKPISRKLSFIDSKTIGPIPAIPTPLFISPTQSPIGYSVPAYVARSPLPPLVGTVAPPPLPHLYAPDMPPLLSPASPFRDWPPCNPINGGGGGGGPVGAPETGVMKQGMWCVAKPSVPADTLMEAMNYACGEGGADCDEIEPNGICYYPNTVVAHASYAFNSYWQKSKRNGGTCSFGGTAMIINADPSFRQCRFMLS